MITNHWWDGEALSACSRQSFSVLSGLDGRCRAHLCQLLCLVGWLQVDEDKSNKYVIAREAIGDRSNLNESVPSTTLITYLRKRTRTGPYFNAISLYSMPNSVSFCFHFSNGTAHNPSGSFGLVAFISSSSKT